MKRCYLVLLVLLVIGMSATANAALVAVPNGDFELIYLPGSTSVTGTMDGWTMGVGPGTNQHPGGGVVTFSDGSTGTTMDIPGWINAPDWPTSYDWDKGSASIGSQDVPPSGTNYLTANGGGWGNAGGGAIESAATLTTVEAGMTYTISALVNGPVTPVVLDLLANDVVLASSSVVDPGTYAWSPFSKTYDAADLTGYLGQALRIRAGWGPDAIESQSQMDMVTMTAIPEPATMLLLGLGGLSLVRRKRR
jgi:hypothetical protein